MIDPYQKHYQKLIELMAEAQKLDIDHYQLHQYRNQVKTAIVQSKCKHNLMADKQRTHNTEVILWKCTKCKKVVDVETL